MNKYQRIQYIALSVVFAGTTAWFLEHWTRLSDVLPDNFGFSRGSDLLDLALFAALTITLVFPFYMFLLAWIVAGRIRNETHAEFSADDEPLRVAMITTFVPGAEPLGMLEDTLRKMIAVRDLPGWSHDTWVLDEGGDAAVKALCHRIGARYFTRHGVPELNTVGGKYSMKTKGGNHNSWYNEVGFSEYDIVSQWDTDFLVEPDALEKIIPFFANEKVAWVGTPQVYDNLDSFIARGAAEQTYLFYGPFLRGLSGENYSMMLGANHTVRVAALQEIDGYDAHLTEDLATGLRLHAKGWQSKFIPEALALGEGPTTWSAYFKQQFRWAKGCIDLLFTQSLGHARTMPRFVAMLYLWLQQFYLGSAAFGLGLVLLVLSFGFGWHSTSIQFTDFLKAYLPLWLTVEVLALWLQQFTCRPRKEWGLYLRARVLMTLAMPVYLFALIAAIRDRGKHTVFEVTPKGDSTTVSVTIHHGPRKRAPHKSPFTPHVVVSTIAGLTLITGIALHRLDFVNVFWAVVVLASGLGLALSLSWTKVVALLRTRSLTIASRVHSDHEVPHSAVDYVEEILSQS